MQLAKQRQRVWSDARGATMVMGVFIAALLVGMIYYVWGIGDAVMHRERMQDAADTAAFSAAVLHARGMNMLALLNTVMAALAAVAATMKSIATWTLAAAGIASSICAGCGPYCSTCCEACPYIAVHAAEGADAAQRADDVSDTVESLLDGLHAYAEAIRVGVPIAAQAKVVAYGTDVYAPVTDVGLMFPIHELPAEDDPTSWPCDNKVWPYVLALTPPGTYASATSSQYLAIATPIGMASTFVHSREWCDDGYFQRVLTDARAGGEHFQLQAFMVGDHDLEWTQEGVATATWHTERDSGSEYGAAAQLGRVSFAQAEFFYDADEDDSREWLWHLNWRARLRRWRLEGLGAGGLTQACGGACGGLSAAEDAVVH